MLIEQLFAEGTMMMGPSRIDPNRQVGVFAPQALAGLPALRTSELEKFRWIEGEWDYENAVPQTRFNPAYSDIGTQKFTITGDGWVCTVGPDGAPQRSVTFDPLSRQWIYVLTRGSFGMLRSKEGWNGGQISFSGLMTMVGIECEWRMTWSRNSDTEFRFINEERNAGGSWAYIDEWRFRRRDNPGGHAK